MEKSRRKSERRASQLGVIEEISEFDEDFGKDLSGYAIKLPEVLDNGDSGDSDSDENPGPMYTDGDLIKETCSM